MRNTTRTYPQPELTTSLKLTRVHQAHRDLESARNQLAHLEAGTNPFGLGAGQLAGVRRAVTAREAEVARLEAQYGTLEALRAQHAAEQAAGSTAGRA